jgi:uridine kinase
LRLKRRVNRDVNQRGRSEKDVINLFSKRLDSMHKKYVIPVKKYCDLVINTEVEINYDELIKKIKLL